MSKLEAAREIAAFGRKLKAFMDIVPELEKLGSLEQATVEVENKLGLVQDRVVEAEAELEQAQKAIVDAKSSAAEIIAKAKSDAVDIGLKAEATARSRAAEITDAANRYSSVEAAKADKLRSEITSLEAVRDGLTTEISSLSQTKSQIEAGIAALKARL